MLNIDIYGYAVEEICAGSCHEASGSGEGSSGQGCSACHPVTKRSTASLVEEFRTLLEGSEYGDKAILRFHEADDSIKGEAPEIHALLSAAQLSPATTVNGKVLFLGGFSAPGLLEEVRKRYPL